MELKLPNKDITLHLLTDLDNLPTKMSVFKKELKKLTYGLDLTKKLSSNNEIKPFADHRQGKYTFAGLYEWVCEGVNYIIKFVSPRETGFGETSRCPFQTGDYLKLLNSIINADKKLKKEYDMLLQIEALGGLLAYDIEFGIDMKVEMGTGIYMIMRKGTPIKTAELNKEQINKILEKIVKLNELEKPDTEDNEWEGGHHYDFKPGNIITLESEGKSEIKFIDYEDTLHIPRCVEDPESSCNNPENTTCPQTRAYYFNNPLSKITGTKESEVEMTIAKGTTADIFNFGSEEVNFILTDLRIDYQSFIIILFEIICHQQLYNNIATLPSKFEKVKEVLNDTDKFSHFFVKHILPLIKIGIKTFPTIDLVMYLLKKRFYNNNNFPSEMEKIIELYENRKEQFEFEQSNLSLVEKINPKEMETKLIFNPIHEVTVHGLLNKKFKKVKKNTHKKKKKK